MRILWPSSVFVALLVPVSLCGQWQAAAYLGKAHTQNTGVQITQPTGTDLFFKNIAFADRSFSTPLYYGLRAGYLLTPSFGIEGELIHLKVFARVNEAVAVNGRLNGHPVSDTMPLTIVLRQYNISHGLNLLLANAAFNHKIVERITVTFRGGIGPAIPHAEIKTPNEELDEYQLRETAKQVSAGVEFELTRSWHYLGEYKLTAAKSRFELPSTRIENSFLTHHLVTGFAFRF